MSSTWFRLVDAEGQPFKRHEEPSVVRRCNETSVLVVDFKDEVKNKFADSYLKGIAAPDLKVYRSRDAFDSHWKAVADGRTDIEINDIFLNFNDAVPASTSEHPLIVLVDARALEQAAEHDAIGTAILAEIKKVQSQLRDQEEPRSILAEIKKVQSQLRDQEEPRSIAISRMSRELVDEIREEHFELGLRAARWPLVEEVNEPRGVMDGYLWANEPEDAIDQRAGYVEYLKKFVVLPNEYVMKDCSSIRDLLSIYRPIGGYRISGTTDVVITEGLQSRQRSTIRTCIYGQLEVKKTVVSATFERQQAQTIMALLAASSLSSSLGVLTVLSDLNNEWHFYWLSSDATRVLWCQTTRRRAKYLLDNMFYTVENCPEDFCNRGTWDTYRKRGKNEMTESHQLGKREEDGGNNGGNPDGRASPPPKRQRNAGHGRHDSSSAGSSSSQREHGAADEYAVGEFAGQQQQRQYARLVTSSRTDVANMHDVGDMLTEQEQFDVTMHFLAEHVVPKMIGVDSVKELLSSNNDLGSSRD